MRGPTASFRSGIGLQMDKKDVFNINILKMPVARLFKFQLAYKCTVAFCQNYIKYDNYIKVFTQITNTAPQLITLANV